MTEWIFKPITTEELAHKRGTYESIVIDFEGSGYHASVVELQPEPDGTVKTTNQIVQGIRSALTRRKGKFPHIRVSVIAGDVVLFNDNVAEGSE